MKAEKIGKECDCKSSKRVTLRIAVARPYHLLFESVLVELLERRQALSWQQAQRLFRWR